MFVDGCFWHGCHEHQVIPKSNRDYWVPKLRRNADRDREVDQALMVAGWQSIIRIWDHEPDDVAADRVEEAVNQAF